MALRRRITETLKEWKDRPNHKPLVIMGIRQCGKTYISQKLAVVEPRFFRLGS